MDFNYQLIGVSHSFIEYKFCVQIAPKQVFNASERATADEFFSACSLRINGTNLIIKSEKNVV